MVRAHLPILVVTLALTHCRCGEQELNKDLPSLRTPVEALEFGAVTQGTSVEDSVHVANTAGGKLEITAAFAPGASADFTLLTPSLTLGSLEEGELQVRFAPSDDGEDSATLILTTSDEKNPRVEVAVHGGPIHPTIVATPSPLTFPNAVAFTELGVVTLRNAGKATLHLRSVGVAPGGNPDFSVQALTGEVVLAPDETHDVRVTYARSIRNSEGHLIALSDDPVTPSLDVTLVPSPVGLCGDLNDNDQDGLTDYPDDPGCNDVNDDDETDPPACLDGATIRCGSDEGACRAGTRTCVNGRFGACSGEQGPTEERCDGLDDDCDGQTDEFLGCGPIDPVSSSSSAPSSSSSSSSMMMASSSSVMMPQSSSMVVTQSSSAMPMCTMNEECANIVDNSAGCYLTECTGGMCTATLRHDSTSWVVTPRLTPEIKVGDNARPMKVEWDGENFLVVMVNSDASQFFARRVSPAGVIIDPVPFMMPEHFVDIAWGGDRHMVITTEPGDGDPLSQGQFIHVSGQMMSRSGAFLSQKQVLLQENGIACVSPGMSANDVAYGGGQFLVTGTMSGCYGIKWALVGGINNDIQGAGGIGDQSRRPRYPAPAGKPGGGFGLMLSDLAIGGGLDESYITSVEANGQAYPLAPYVKVDGFNGDGYCCSNSLSLIFGTRNFLASYARYTQTYEIISPNLLPGDDMMPPHPNVQVQGLYGPTKGAELGFDGTNFLAITGDTDQVLTGVRFNEDGVLLDATPFPLTPAMDNLEYGARLAYDRAGRYALAYYKARDSHAYVRLFSTCP